MPSEFVSVETESGAADQAAARGQYAQAAVHLRRLCTQTRAVDYEFDDWCRRLADAFARLGRRREAGFLYLYLHYFDQARQAFAGLPGPETGRCLVLEKRYPEAAAELVRAGFPVQAAVAFEEAKDAPRAAELWAKLLTERKLEGRAYERALVHTNLGLALCRGAAGTAKDGRRHLAMAQRLFEQIADDFESAGERERAFDCYQVLLKLGQDSDSFENLSEGYLNCIRILKEDGLKTYVMQYYDDFLGQALAKEEFHAAATLCREVADYAVRAGLPYQRHYLRRAAETWAREAGKLQQGGAPLELVENAHLAAIEALSLLGDYPGVMQSYQKLADLELVDRKKARYRAIATRFRGAPLGESDGTRFPEYMRQQRAYGDIWFVDLVEWEQDGDPEQVAGLVCGDLRYPDGIRRRALNLVLDVAEARARNAAEVPQAKAAFADGLGDLQSYAALRPLERLYEHPDGNVRRQAILALRKLYFKRSFGLIGKALRDQHEPVREAAIEAVRALHFTHAFHPLARIFREEPDEKVKVAALESIGRIGSIEAGELLVATLRHETGNLREVARKALAVFDNADVLPILQQHLEHEASPDVRKTLEELLARRRGR